MDHHSAGDGPAAERSSTAQLTSPFRDLAAGETESPLHEDFSWGEDEEELEHDVQFEDEAEAEDEDEAQFEDEAEDEDEAQFADETETQLSVGEGATYEVGPDPSLVALAERIASSSAEAFESEVRRHRWTRCFATADIQRTQTPYQENAAARAKRVDDSASCIVMLNVGLGHLLPLPLRDALARGRGKTTRKVRMGRLTTQSIEKAMAQLQSRGYAMRPVEMNSLDRRNKRAGTLKPEKLRASVSQRVLALSRATGCWYAYGLSIMDGYHSVLLLVDRTGPNARIYWLDQFKSGVNDDVTTTLDERLTKKTQDWWQAVKDQKKFGSDTTIRLWPLRKRVRPN